MGCSTSRSNGENDQEGHGPTKDEFVFMTPEVEKLLTSKNPEDLLTAFIQLDKVIMVEESRNPSAIFGHAMSKQQLLKAHLQSAAEKRNQNEILSGESPTYDLFNDVGLVRNPAVAAEHEEFLASINRRALNEKAIDILQQMLDSVDEQIRKSSARINQLQNAYHQQDELLGQIFGETYGSETERLLEKELDTMRYFRDVLSIGALQWEHCTDNIRTAANLLRKAVASWKSIRKQSMEQKIGLATNARDALQEALLFIQTAQELLQDVQFPYCTARELKGVSQTMEYMFTDILIEERYLHASEMYENFLQRTISLQEWVKEVLCSQLQRDLLEIEEKVSAGVDKLRHERIYLICKKLRIQPPSDALLRSNATPSAQAPVFSTYSETTSGPKAPVLFEFDKFPVNLESKLGLRPEGGENSVQNYFRRAIENRKNRMWPSRRIDELQALTLQQYPAAAAEQPRKTPAAPSARNSLRKW